MSRVSGRSGEQVESVKPKDFDIYKWGLVMCSVCSSLTLEETTKRLNTQMPTGIQSQWQLSSSNFTGSDTNTIPCDKYPTTHKHYLFNC